MFCGSWQPLRHVVTVIWIVRGVMCSVDSNSQLQPLRHVVTVIWIVRGVMCSVDSDS